jgi:hypothetical protein
MKVMLVFKFRVISFLDTDVAVSNRKMTMMMTYRTAKRLQRSTRQAQMSPKAAAATMQRWPAYALRHRPVLI